MQMEPQTPFGQLSDADVVAAANSRDALEHLVVRIVPRVRLMVTARLGGRPEKRHLVPDLTQIVLSAVSSRIGTLERQSVGGLNAFVSAIVDNNVADCIRGRGQFRGERGRAVSLDGHVVDLSSAMPLWQALSLSGVSPPSAVGREESIDQMLQTLESLPERQRRAIVLAFFDQLPTAVIGERMGVTRAAASMLIVRAVRELRRRMQPGAQEGDDGPTT